MDLSEQGRTLLTLIVNSIRTNRFDPEHPETFLGYQETLNLLDLPQDVPRGDTPARTLQLNGLTDLAKWIHRHSKLPRITGLIVSTVSVDKEDGRRPRYVPGVGYFLEYNRNKEDWQWWLKEVKKSLLFDWSPYINSEATFTPEEVRYVGMVDEGSEREVPAKIRQRSVSLRNLAREHYRRDSPDGKLHCAACDWAKPDFPLAHEIVEIHHTEELNSYPKTGRRLPETEALRLLVPVCPNCHRMLRAKPGGSSFTVDELRIYLRDS